ncbi:MAG: inverse autotransporter beta domain-containing protein [Candidatus Symbiodolus clandestinus]
MIKRELLSDNTHRLSKTGLFTYRGIHYTPVPLLTLYYRYQRIHSQQTNHQYGITLIYRVNSSLKKQLAPT